MIEKLIRRLYICAVLVVALMYIVLSVWTLWNEQNFLEQEANEQVENVTSTYYMPRKMGFENWHEMFGYLITVDESGNEIVTHYSDLDEQKQQLIMNYVLKEEEPGEGMRCVEAPPQFFVYLDANGHVQYSYIEIGVKTELTLKKMEEVAKEAYADESEFGWCGNMRYRLQKMDNYSIMTFSDCTYLLEKSAGDNREDILYYVIKFATTTALLTVLFLVFSGPIKRSYTKQRQFITNASHDLKTPLTLIRTNLDILRSDYGESVLIEEMQQEVDGMTVKINELVKKSKLDEVS